MKLKLMQFIGTRNKTDFVIYLSHVLTQLDKRVLIVDNTRNEWYRNGYARETGEQRLFDFQGIDILYGTSNWLDIEAFLQQSGETSINYDVILMDMDTTEILEQEWPVFNERFYVGDFDRGHQLRDVELLRTLFRTSESNELKRITFESKYKMDAAYFESILKVEVAWRSMNYLFEPDDFSDDLRIHMQHEQDIPFRRLNKQYKELLSEIVSALYEVHIKDVTDAVKPSFFSFRSKPIQKKSPVLESSNA